MGEIADAMLNGDMCEQCGEWLGDGPGYPRNCGCSDPETFSIGEGIVRGVAQRRHQNEEILKKADLSPTKITNQGACWCFRGGEQQADFYPGTGRWRDIGSGKVRSGGAKAFILWMDTGKVY
jgi:hypothetical protein